MSSGWVEESKAILIQEILASQFSMMMRKISNLS